MLVTALQTYQYGWRNLELFVFLNALRNNTKLTLNKVLGKSKGCGANLEFKLQIFVFFFKQVVSGCLPVTWSQLIVLFEKQIGPKTYFHFQCVASRKPKNSIKVQSAHNKMYRTLNNVRA